ncbi:patatin-like protein 3 isoform X1 [Cannabis sativa]|uniref:patatin-like protein 3 isoform X1 n=1 Tax=Cannabis sativa TaxID=3483 RepID=UPI0029CAA297|nr:patatin-like protein 3 isoform X1 [Cannabis sativa]
MSKNNNMGVGAGTTTILSIDGGGVRGIIPGVMLDFLESKLQEFDKNARLADYFDVISGTSTGGLIATMISTPNDKGRPLYAAKDIVPFYKKECPQIFKKSACPFRNLLSHQKESGVAVEMKMSYHSENCHDEMHLKIPHPTTTTSYGVGKDNYSKNESLLLKSIYDGNYLHRLVRGILGKKVLRDTLTKVVIPAYDINKLSPVIFSSYEVLENKNEELNACLSDICISTSAAPIYLPAYKFTNQNTEFNMIDGGVAANNPTVAAITEVLKRKRINKVDHQLEKGKGKKRKKDTNNNEDGDQSSEDHHDYGDLLVLSLGTGADKVEGKYNADIVNGWSILNWIQNPSWNFFWNPDRPIFEIMADANADMIDHYTTIFFQNYHQNFLRIQDSELPKDLSAMDNSDPTNLEKLEQYAKDLLHKPVTRLDLPTFKRIVMNKLNQTYQDALEEFAKKLIFIKKSRAEQA